jgi:hypothetical protein
MAHQSIRLTATQNPPGVSKRQCHPFSVRAYNVDNLTCLHSDLLWWIGKFGQCEWKQGIWQWLRRQVVTGYCSVPLINQDIWLAVLSFQGVGPIKCVTKILPVLLRLDHKTTRFQMYSNFRTCVAWYYHNLKKSPQIEPFLTPCCA